MRIVLLGGPLPLTPVGRCVQIDALTHIHARKMRAYGPFKLADTLNGKRQMNIIKTISIPLIMGHSLARIRAQMGASHVA